MSLFGFDINDLKPEHWRAYTRAFAGAVLWDLALIAMMVATIVFFSEWCFGPELKQVWLIPLGAALTMCWYTKRQAIRCRDRANAIIGNVNNLNLRTEKDP